MPAVHATRWLSNHVDQREVLPQKCLDCCAQCVVTSQKTCCTMVTARAARQQSCPVRLYCRREATARGPTGHALCTLVAATSRYLLCWPQVTHGCQAMHCLGRSGAAIWLTFCVLRRGPASGRGSSAPWGTENPELLRPQSSPREDSRHPALAGQRVFVSSVIRHLS